MKKLLLSVTALSAAVAGAFAQTIPAGDAVALSSTTPGLAGGVYHDGSAQLAPNATTGLGTPGSAGYIVYVNSTPANATYTANSFNYTGKDTTPTNTFLAGDANGSAATDASAIHTTVFDTAGYLHVTVPGAYTFATNSDDGSEIYIGGETQPGTAAGSGVLIVNNDGSHGSVTKNGTATFTATGYYPIEIVYFNQDFNNGGGGANFQLNITDAGGGTIVNGGGNLGGGVSANNGALVSGTAAVPEPSTWLAAGGILLLAAGDFRRRRRG